MEGLHTIRPCACSACQHQRQLPEATALPARAPLQSARASTTGADLAPEHGRCILNHPSILHSAAECNRRRSNHRSRQAQRKRRRKHAVAAAYSREWLLSTAITMPLWPTAVFGRTAWPPVSPPPAPATREPSVTNTGSSESTLKMKIGMVRERAEGESPANARSIAARCCSWWISSAASTTGGQQADAQGQPQRQAAARVGGAHRTHGQVCATCQQLRT